MRSQEELLAEMRAAVEAARQAQDSLDRFAAAMTYNSTDGVPRRLLVPGFTVPAGYRWSNAGPYIYPLEEVT